MAENRFDVRRPFRQNDFPSTAPTPPGATPHTAPLRESLNSQASDVRERARRYLAAIPPAIAGRQGDTTTFRVCCRLVRGFALSQVDALSVLKDWNDRCQPPWTEAELRAKLRSALEYGREPVGGLLH